MLLGYARVSTPSQATDTQRHFLTEAGCERLFDDICSGLTLSNRPGLDALFDFARNGDTLVITWADRLTRSSVDFREITGRLQLSGIRLLVLSSPDAPIEQLRGAIEFAEIEAAHIKARCEQGREAARACLKVTGKTHRGKESLGRRPACPPQEVVEWRRLNNASLNETRQHFSISKATVARYCAAADAP